MPSSIGRRGAFLPHVPRIAPPRRYARLTGEADLHFVFAVKRAETAVAARVASREMALALDSAAEDPAGVV